jgi:tetratricopeptide (TPR) repeat protein
MARLVWVSIASSLIIGVSGALADGGGGGGMGGSMPSASAPQYDPVAEYAKGAAAMQASNYKAAARAFQNVTSVAPANNDAWRMLGAARSGAGDWKGARSAYQRTLKLAPADAVAHAGLGVAMARLKDAKAQAELDWLKARAAACGAGCPEAGRLAALTAEVEGAMSGATASTAPTAPRAMLQLAPGFGDASYLQAVELINERRYDQALEALGQASQALGPHPDILTYKGYVWRKKGDLARARDYYEQALAIAPDHMGATEYYGELKVVSGDRAGALGCSPSSSVSAPMAAPRPRSCVCGSTTAAIRNSPSDRRPGRLRRGPRRPGRAAAARHALAAAGRRHGPGPGLDPGRVPASGRDRR